MEIEKAVEAADSVIVCLSNNSVSKEGYVQRELKFVIEIALEKPEGIIFIIPIRKELSLVSTLADIAKEFAHIEIGKDTPKKDLNIILSPFPKTRDVKG